MAIEQTFTTTSPSIVSYTFTNFIESSAGINYYPGNGLDENASEDNIMSSTQFESNTKESYNVANHADTLTLLETQTYSTSETINAVTIRGKCIIQIGWGMRANNNNQGQSRGYIVARLVAGGVTLGEGKTEERVSTGTAYTISKEGNSVLSFDVTNKVLKVGDTLSIVLLIYGRRESGSVGGYVVNGHDPMNNDGSYLKPSEADVDTMIKAQIPFRSIL